MVYTKLVAGVVSILLRSRGWREQKINCDAVNKKLSLVNYEDGNHK